MGLRVEHVTVTILTKRGRPTERYFRRQGLKKNQCTVCAYIQAPPWRREKENRALVAECQSTAADKNTALLFGENVWGLVSLHVF